MEVDLYVYKSLAFVYVNHIREIVHVTQACMHLLYTCTPTAHVSLNSLYNLKFLPAKTWRSTLINYAVTIL